LLRNPTSPRKQGEVKQILLGQFGLNHHEDAFDISKNFVVPESKHSVTFFGQATISYGIRSGFIMLPTINLDYHSQFAANKVADVTEDRHLPCKFVSVDLPIANAIPKNGFRIGLIDPQSPCDSDGLLVAAPHCLAPHPALQERVSLVSG
jgi:hypothetical protein